MSKDYESTVCVSPEIQETENGGKPRVAFVRGDCDGSGRVDSRDVYALSLSLTLRKSMPCRAAFDVNGDGRINYLDVTYLSNFIHKWGRAPVAPFPTCGVGRQRYDDRLGCSQPSRKCK